MSKIYNPETLSEVDTDMLQLISNSTPIPVYIDVDIIKQAVYDILHILNDPAKSNIPTVLKGDKIKEAFRQISTLLGTNKAKELPHQPMKSYAEVVKNTDKTPTPVQNSQVTSPIKTKVPLTKITKPKVPNSPPRVKKKISKHG